MSDFDDVDDLADLDPDVPEFDDTDLDEALAAADDDDLDDDVELDDLGLVGEADGDLDDAADDDDVVVTLETDGGVPDDGDGDDEPVAPGGGEATALVEEDDLLDDVAAKPLGVERDLDVDDEVREGEFVCRSCFMAKRESALADEDQQLCRDCV